MVRAFSCVWPLPTLRNGKGVMRGYSTVFGFFWAETGGGMDWRVVMALGCGTEVIGHLGLRYEGVGEGRMVRVGASEWVGWW